MPLRPTYIQLQMADQTFREIKGIVTDVPVKIDDHFVYTDVDTVFGHVSFDTHLELMICRSVGGAVVTSL